jgi:hypothetical protein
MSENDFEPRDPLGGTWVTTMPAQADSAEVVLACRHVSLTGAESATCEKCGPLQPAGNS